MVSVFTNIQPFSELERVCLFHFRNRSSSSSLGSRSVPWLGDGLPCRIQVSLSCAVFCQIVPLQYMSRSSLHRLADLPCRLFLALWSPSGEREVHRSSLSRLICPAQDHFILLTLLIISITVVLSQIEMFVFLSLYVMLSILLSILVCACRKFVLCLF